MANVTVTIPDGKLQFFKNLVENLGFNYTETNEEQISIPKWQQKEVNNRYEDYKDNPDKAIEINDVINQIDEKYGL